MAKTQNTPPASGSARDQAPGPTFPPERYGHRRGPDHHRRWLVILLTGLVAAAGLGITVTLYQRYGNPPYRAQVLGIMDVSEHGLTVRFEVRKPAGQPARCTVRARNYAGEEVGRAEVVVPAGQPDQTVTEISYRLTTSRTAFVGEVPRCGPAG